MMKIVAYLKPHCGWSMGVRAVMKKYGLEYEDRDIINDRKEFDEMCRKTGQSLSPCVEVNGHMLSDVSGEEVENYMVEKGYIQRKNDEPEAPIDSACNPKMHAREDIINP